MTTWRDIAVQQARAARRLVGTDVVRLPVSRAYYAAYSGIVQALHDQGLRRFGPRNNPDHVDVPALVLHNLASLDAPARRALAADIRRLRARREDADYRPQRSIDGSDRLRAIWEMDRAMAAVGIAGVGA